MGEIIVLPTPERSQEGFAEYWLMRLEQAERSVEYAKIQLGALALQSPE